MYNFLHKHKDYAIKYCITIKVLVYILKQLLKHLFILCQLVSRSACMSVCTMYALGTPGGRKSVCGFLQLTKPPMDISLSPDTGSRALSTLSTTIHKML